MLGDLIEAYLSAREAYLTASPEDRALGAIKARMDEAYTALNAFPHRIAPKRTRSFDVV